MPRYQKDPARRAVLEQILAATAQVSEWQRDGQWITYLIRDPRFRDKRGNRGTPIYVGQTNDLPTRVLSRFMKCEKVAAGKTGDCVERRIANLLHLGIVANYEVLEYQPTRLTSLVSETNWSRKCWNAGYHIANRAELQKAGGPPVGRSDIPESWLAKFSLPEAIADDILLTVSCSGCGENFDIPPAAIPQLERASTTIGQIAKLVASESCTLCGAGGRRRVRLRATD